MPGPNMQSFAVSGGAAGGAANGAVRQSVRQAFKVPVFPIVVVIYTTLLPREMSIRVGENFIYMDRLALLLTVPFILNYLYRGAIKFVLPDWLVLAQAVWMVASLFVVHDGRTAMVTGLSLSFDAVAGYYLARISFRSLDDIRRALILCAPAFFLSGIMVMLESISHRVIVRPFFSSVFGIIRYTKGAMMADPFALNDVRMGLMRASGAWVHPILAGLHLSTLLAVYWMSGIRGWPKFLAISAAALGFFSVSSSALLSLALQIGCIFYDWLCSKVAGLNWRWVAIAAVGLVVLAEIASNRGFFGLLIAFGTLDPQTGFFRQLIWTYGLQSVSAHPVFGIGFNDYARPIWMVSNSVDAHWLLYAMRFGLPAALFLFIASLSAIFALMRSEAYASRTDARFYRGLLIGFSVLIIMAFTVALQGGTLTWFTMLLGGCVACAQHGFAIRKPVVAAGRMVPATLG